jgi:hypothetical protein
MITLHSTTDLVKTTGKWLAILISSILLIFLLIKGGTFIKERYFPEPDPPPTTPYGKLEKITFPKSALTQQFTYVLDTKSASLPNFPDREKVYPIKKNQSTLLNLDRAKTKVKEIKFTNIEGEVVPETTLSESLYMWQDSSELQRRIQMDIVSFNFTMSSIFPDDVASDSAIIRAIYLPNENVAKDIAKGFLGDMSLFPDDIDEKRTRTELLALRDGAVVRATGLANAHAIRVDFYQNEINKKKIVYPNPPNSTMYFYIASDSRQANVVHANFIHSEANTENNSATYPIITAKEAYELLQQNKAYLASYYGTGNEVVIKDIYIAYYVGDNSQKFLLPVIVFEGSDGFFAYVSALKNEWLK